jgi:hypothetical protein
MNQAHKTTAADLAATIRDIAAGSKAAVVVTITSPEGATELKRFVVTSTRHTTEEIADHVRLTTWRYSGFMDVTELPTPDDVDRVAYHVEEERVQHAGDHDDRV